MATPFNPREGELAHLIPANVELVSGAMAWTWVRNGFALNFMGRNFRGKGQEPLPSGSSPLLAWGGEAVQGQEFTIEEVMNYIQANGLNPDNVCIYEFQYTR